MDLPAKVASDALPQADRRDPALRARVSDQLNESLIEEAAACGGDARGGRATRADGWTPERIRIFLETLAQCGVVGDAARAAGIGIRSAYNLRNSARGRAFHHAWNAALHLARHTLADVVMSRALNGCVEIIVRDGQVWGERHRYDNRLTMAVLARLDNEVAKSGRDGATTRVVTEEFDQFVDIVCAGGDGAADFIARRESYRTDCELALLTRLDNFLRYQAGHPSEIDVSDIESLPVETLDAEQLLRAERAGLLAGPADEDGRDDDDDDDEEEYD